MPYHAAEWRTIALAQSCNVEHIISSSGGKAAGRADDTDDGFWPELLQPCLNR